MTHDKVKTLKQRVLNLNYDLRQSKRKLRSRRVVTRITRFNPLKPSQCEEQLNAGIFQYLKHVPRRGCITI